MSDTADLGLARSESSGDALAQLQGEASARIVTVRFHNSALSISGPAEISVSPGLPQMIPADELPFWTREWQELIQEGRDAIAEGDTVAASDFRGLASWLLSTDE
jgi:hypothetical protein